MMVTKVQEEAQEGLDRSSCHFSLASYNTSEVLDCGHTVSMWKGPNSGAELSEAEHLRLHYIIFAIVNAWRIATAPLVYFNLLTICHHQEFCHPSASQCPTGPT